MPLAQLLTFDGLAVVALAAAVVVHRHRVASQAAEAKQAVLRRFAIGELDLDAYEEAMFALGGGPGGPSGRPSGGHRAVA